MLSVDLLDPTTDLEQAREAFHDSHPAGVELTRELTRMMVGGGSVDELLATADELDAVQFGEETRELFRENAALFDRFNRGRPEAARTLNYYVAGLDDVSLAEAREARDSLRDLDLDIEVGFSVCIRDEDLDALEDAFIET